MKDWHNITYCLMAVKCFLVEKSTKCEFGIVKIYSNSINISLVTKIVSNRKQTDVEVIN